MLPARVPLRLPARNQGFDGLIKCALVPGMKKLFSTKKRPTIAMFHWKKKGVFKVQFPLAQLLRSNLDTLFS